MYCVAGISRLHYYRFGIRELDLLPSLQYGRYFLIDVGRASNRIPSGRRQIADIVYMNKHHAGEAMKEEYPGNQAGISIPQLQSTNSTASRIPTAIPPVPSIILPLRIARRVQ